MSDLPELVHKLALFDRKIVEEIIKIHEKIDNIESKQKQIINALNKDKK